MPEPKPPHKLLAEMADALASADGAVREAWERIRMGPELWHGPAREQVWALAVSGAHVWWYDEAEQQFVRSAFAIRGFVGECGGGVYEFGSVLESLPEGEEAEAFARAAPASVVPVELQDAGRIGRRQTTYWELQPAGGRIVRVHFSGKQEARFAGAAYDRVAVDDRHPLLIDFDETWAEVYVAGAQRTGPRLIAELNRRVEAATEGWRSAAEYLSGSGYRALAAGHGLLMRAPASVARIAADAVAEQGAEPSVVSYPAGAGERRAAGRLRALLLGRSFVIAEAFRFVRVD